jgi:hypothetical protein
MIESNGEAFQSGATTCIMNKGLAGMAKVGQ